MPVSVVTDSGSDLPPDVAAEHGIAVVPLGVHLDDGGPDPGLDADEFWRRLTAAECGASTASPSPASFAAAFDAAGRGGNDVLCITIASALSGTIEAARLGAREARCRVEVVDSGSASLGTGLLAIDLARTAARGASLDELCRLARDGAARTEVWAVLDDLAHLRRGGRIGGAAALVGTALALKPVIRVDHDGVHAGGRHRTRRRAVDALVELVNGAGPLDAIAVLHSGDADEAAQVADRVGVLDQRTWMIGPVIGAHSGPRTIGVAWRRAAPH